ncbi:MAG: hypothetical protein JW748_10785 [Anaerolineales bacterium]|nr:hypothetical protein [Anaerolineales bacterium]
MENPTPALPSPSRPPKLQTIGILMLISGVLNVMAGLGIVTGFALSVVLICCIPLAALPLALGVFEVIYGLRLVGSGQEPVARDTLQTVAILEIASILGSNIVSFIAGVINLVLLSDTEVVASFKK